VRPEEIGTIADPYAPLRFTAFRWFVVSLLPSTLAQQVQAVVVGWQIYALTHDPLALGLSSGECDGREGGVSAAAIGRECCRRAS
jgi:hypothetical protein